ncbi:hypothetical protein KSP40_PGU012363 [Platanthera guangdongensis]|uniref:Chromo domain-containing protein n=1 Tax=Platanthera guangdongensis TaxID=2320717 RepID=A0ABR2N0Z5_9ASPA
MRQVLIQWKDQPAEEATWNLEEEIKAQFSEFELEDKVVVESRVVKKSNTPDAQEKCILRLVLYHLLEEVQVAEEATVDLAEPCDIIGYTDDFPLDLPIGIDTGLSPQDATHLCHSSDLFLYPILPSDSLQESVLDLIQEMVGPAMRTDNGMDHRTHSFLPEKLDVWAEFAYRTALIPLPDGATNKLFPGAILRLLFGSPSASRPPSLISLPPMADPSWTVDLVAGLGGRDVAPLICSAPAGATAPPPHNVSRSSIEEEFPDLYSCYVRWNGHFEPLRRAGAYRQSSMDGHS